MQLTPEDKLLLSVVKLQPSVEELENINVLIPQIKDWEGFTNNIIAHGSAPLLFKKLSLLNNNSLIPAEVKTKLQQAYYKTLTRRSESTRLNSSHSDRSRMPSSA
jgi:hypothetical protein